MESDVSDDASSSLVITLLELLLSVVEVLFTDEVSSLLVDESLPGTTFACVASSPLPKSTSTFCSVSPPRRLEPESLFELSELEFELPLSGSGPGAGAGAGLG